MIVKRKVWAEQTVGVDKHVCTCYNILAFDLRQEGDKVTGIGILSLAGGQKFLLLARGKVKTDIVSLRIRGDTLADPAVGGIKLKADVVTLADGSARVLSMSGKAFGQSILWEKQ